MLSVRDDGVGGADATRGSGLVGLTDRVEALGGSIRVSSRPGQGTQITAELPLELELPQPGRPAGRSAQGFPSTLRRCPVAGTERSPLSVCKEAH